MIAWSIETALASGCFDQVIVSTDDTEIAEVARSYGALVPFLRPAALADDHTGTIPVIQQAIQWCQQNERVAQQVCCLYATAPFVSALDLQRGLSKLEASGADYAFSTTSFAFPIQRALKIDEYGRVAMFNPENFNKRSQDLEEAFHDAGQFYWGKAEAWLQGSIIFSNGSVSVPLARHRVQDIDTEEDWLRAEWLFKAMQAESI